MVGGCRREREGVRGVVSGRRGVSKEGGLSDDLNAYPNERRSSGVTMRGKKTELQDLSDLSFLSVGQRALSVKISFIVFVSSSCPNKGQDPLNASAIPQHQSHMTTFIRVNDRGQLRLIRTCVIGCNWVMESGKLLRLSVNVRSLPPFL